MQISTRIRPRCATTAVGPKIANEKCATENDIRDLYSLRTGAPALLHTPRIKLENINHQAGNLGPQGLQLRCEQPSPALNDDPEDEDGHEDVCHKCDKRCDV